jgi:hypothetical protein
MHEEVHRKALSDNDLRKEMTKTPQTQLQQGKAQPGSNVGPAHSLPHEGGG